MPIDCAALVCDLLPFDTTVSPDALVESLERAGLPGEVLLMPADVKLEGDMPVARARWRDRTITWHAHGLSQLLYELAEPNSLARGIRELVLTAEEVGRSLSGGHFMRVRQARARGGTTLKTSDQPEGWGLSTVHYRGP